METFLVQVKKNGSHMIRFRVVNNNNFMTETTKLVELAIRSKRNEETTKKNSMENAKNRSSKQLLLKNVGGF